ncbi:Trypsin-2 [Folsomia candida]|uniref:Trypsin-2 n=1 Tax=Folsomia candida TaxID=158441 RepID=A0A226DFE8_FOLCA|nr:Trypsin-2 [Folsomia candida]
MAKEIINSINAKKFHGHRGDESSPQRMRRTVVEDTSAEGYDAIVLSSKCTTTRGKRGTCRKIEECYPFLFPLNKTVEQHVTTMNPELAHILIQISGICDMETSGADRISPQNFRQVLTAEFLICCPHRNPIYPPTPVEPGDVVEEESVKGKRTCGQVQVHLGEENNNPVVPGNETDLEEGATRQLCEGCQQPSKLRTAQVNIWKHEDCKKKYASIIEITEGMVCSGGKGQDSCRGDSGGSLTINSKTTAEQVGLVSFGVE